MNGATERLNSALAGRYQIEKQLGQGGMATVCLAQGLKHDRKVANSTHGFRVRRLQRVIAKGLPGADLVAQGLRDLSAGAESIESLLVSMSAPRLRALGIAVPAPLANPERRLYEVLAVRHGTAAHSRYNALVRRIVSFQRALACAN